MSNRLHFWENYMDKNIKFDLTPDSYILHYIIVNPEANIIYEEWMPFHTENSLVEFFKYVALPSGYLSRYIGTMENRIVLEALEYNDVLQIIDETHSDDNLATNFKTDYKSIDEIEKNITWDDIKGFCRSYNKHLDLKYGVYSEVQVFENIKKVGKELIEEYERDDMIEFLEEKFGASKEEISYMFSSVDNNPFLLKKLISYLDSRVFI